MPVTFQVCAHLAAVHAEIATMPTAFLPCWTMAQRVVVLQQRGIVQDVMQETQAAA
ncbi:hypothetical protein OX459_04710 [Janthinobacterium sp. SUN026]|uniref:hypothetical protein n=1 Tax=Janthinobacterium sp. SUN026 TaxID=3002438 RepID=UPI0025B14C7E|nr:hypothetical protein [Janthinobacterium sp. SUN026]MDN2670694.1 hypothetical protein [Janthinobacterium sp. SUN026]